MTSTTLLSILGLVALVLLIEALRQLFLSGRSGETVRRDRLRRLAETDIVATPAPLRLPASDSWLDRLPFVGRLPARMQQAGMTMDPRVLLLIAAATMAVMNVALIGIIGAPFALLASVLTGICLPVAAINFARRRRLEAFSKQLPDALDLMRRGLSVGHPVAVTIQSVARNMKDPLGPEFRILSEQIAYGDTLVDALGDMADRLDIEDVHYLHAAVTIQHSSGGNLGAMLDTLSTVMRKRFAMRRRIKAVSSEGRITAFVLSGLPVFMYFSSVSASPDYYTSVEDSPLFWPMVIGIVGLMTLNALMLRKLVTFRI